MDADQVILEVPLVHSDSWKQKRDVALEVIRLQGISKGLWWGGMQLNPSLWYVTLKWQKDGKVQGDIVRVYCRKKYSTAAILAVRFLKEVYGVSHTSQLNLHLDTWNESWWSNL